jgi:hypothetical protein
MQILSTLGKEVKLTVARLFSSTGYFEELELDIRYNIFFKVNCPTENVFFIFGKAREKFFGNDSKVFL